MNAEFFAAVADIEKEKGIPKEYMYEKITQALLAAFRKDHVEYEGDVRVLLDESAKKIQLVEYKTVVDDVYEPYCEVTLKSDAQGDPLITERLCIMKGMLKEGQFDQALEILVKVGEVLKKELAGMNLQLIDFKIEVGYDEEGKIYVADEITPDIWRVKDENGNIPNQIDCVQMILAKINK